MIRSIVLNCHVSRTNKQLTLLFNGIKKILSKQCAQYHDSAGLAGQLENFKPPGEILKFFIHH